MGLRGLSRLRRRQIGNMESYTVRQWGSTLAGLDHTRLKLYNVAFYCYGISVYMIPTVQERDFNLRRPIPQALSPSLSAFPASDLLPSSISPFSPSFPTPRGHCSCFALADYPAEAIDIDVVESLDVSVDVIVAVAGQC